MFLSKYRLIFVFVIFILLSIIGSQLTVNITKDFSTIKAQSNTNEFSSFVTSNISENMKFEAVIGTTIASTDILPNCVVLVRYVKGRLGNHLFMFASAYGLSRIHQCSLFIGESVKKELNEIFELNLTNELSKEQARLLEKQHVISQYSECSFDLNLMRPEAVKYLELNGYWQAYGYFSRYLDEIRILLSFKPTVVRLILPFINSLLTKTLSENHNTSFKAVKEHIKMTSSVTWIGIHIRRGDFRRHLAFRAGRTVSSIEFFDKAIAYFTKRYDNRVIFIVASDEKSYCRDIFRNRRNVIVTPDSFIPAADLAALSLCSDMIASSGSFSWWASALAGGIVLHDEQYPRRNSSLEALCPRSLYYPSWFLFL